MFQQIQYYTMFKCPTDLQDEDLIEEYYLLVYEQCKRNMRRSYESKHACYYCKKEGIGKEMFSKDYDYGLQFFCNRGCYNQQKNWDYELEVYGHEPHEFD